jgi:hypothetical protein
MYIITNSYQSSTHLLIITLVHPESRSHVYALFRVGLAIIIIIITDITMARMNTKMNIRMLLLLATVVVLPA